MNAVEIGDAVTDLVEQPFDANEFPFQLLKAFDGNTVTIDKMRQGENNESDIGGILQKNRIHLKTCDAGHTLQTLAELKDSRANAKHKVRFILATDGWRIEAQDLVSGDEISCSYLQLADHFTQFLPLAGINISRDVGDSVVDIKASGRLNELHAQLLRDNPDWAGRSDDMNHFMARLIFLFFAEDTGILNGENLFINTVDTLSEPDGSNTHQVIQEMFQAMDIDRPERAGAGLHSWADKFPYVNGGLFSHDTEVPVFSKRSRNLLMNIGQLDWTRINPDIFGSMIQAVADESERSADGMHYTSVPNILKVLNPLFLNDLNSNLNAAGSNKRKLNALRERMSRIRVFDPACGSGNFLVIAYKKMRGIEAQLNEYSGTPDRRSEIPLTNFRGIELRGFSAEIARLALVIAEYQCDEMYLGQREALAEFLPLTKENWITKGNALRLDWPSVCPPVGMDVNHRGDDLLTTTGEQAEVRFKNEGGETYICGNPPYLGSNLQSRQQKEDMKTIFEGNIKNWKSLDYIAGWFMKAADYGRYANCSSAFVSTNSICQGQQVSTLWPEIFDRNQHINFAHTSFKWENLASHNAGVTVSIIGISNILDQTRKLYSLNTDGESEMKEVENINGYLMAAPNLIVQKADKSLNECAEMIKGNMPYDGGNLLLNIEEVKSLSLTLEQEEKFIRRICGSAEFIQGKIRYCLWIKDSSFNEAMQIDSIKSRVEAVRDLRLASPDQSANKLAERPHQMREMNFGRQHTLIVPSHSSENREYLPVGVLSNKSIVSNSAFALYDAPEWNMALIASKLHRAWIGAVCGRLKTDFRYSNTMGWNTFPVPFLTEQNKADLNQTARGILYAREQHFPATIAEMYKPDAMPQDLRDAHDCNDELIEGIYIGRNFRNDTERLEKLFDMYVKMTREPAKEMTRAPARDITREMESRAVNTEGMEMSF